MNIAWLQFWGQRFPQRKKNACVSQSGSIGKPVFLLFYCKLLTILWGGGGAWGSTVFTVFRALISLLWSSFAWQSNKAIFFFSLPQTPSLRFNSFNSALADRGWILARDLKMVPLREKQITLELKVSRGEHNTSKGPFCSRDCQEYAHHWPLSSSLLHH